MEELINAVVKGLVEDPASVRVARDENPNDRGETVYRINVAPGDMGRVIGKQGRIAKAIRTVVRAAAAKRNMKIAVEID
ncbi:MAG: KH domain-containing protein [Oscillospiraceae bacterium]|nr:KH domain-containing protein [Oscillospiraceae bacterium]